MGALAWFKQWLQRDNLLDQIAARDEKIKILEWENHRLRHELVGEAHTFYVQNRWLGYNQTVYGVVIGGDCVQLIVKENA